MPDACAAAGTTSISPLEQSTSFITYAVIIFWRTLPSFCVAICRDEGLFLFFVYIFVRANVNGTDMDIGINSVVFFVLRL